MHYTGMTTMNSKVDLKTILNWSAPKRVRTTQGERDLLVAMPTPAFSALWKQNKEALKALGISWAKKTVTDEQTGQPVEVWEVLWWRAISAEEAAFKAASLEASKAVSANDVSVPAPKGMEYLGYQLAGIKYASGREGTLLADEMGLGKTIQAIGLVNSDPTIKSVLVVCPASIKLNWGRELRKWLTRPLTIQIVGSGVGWGKADITIVNYEMLVKFQNEIAGREFDLAVIDESHRIKNPKAQRTKVFAQIKAKRRVCMTGTPILNRPVELWTSLIWLDPKRWDKKKSYFEKRYCGAFMGEWGWENGGATHLDELQEVLRTSVMVRRLKKDVLTELPPKQRQVIELDGDSNARRVAKAEVAKFKAMLAEAGIKDDGNYAAAVSKLREADSVAFQSMSRVRHDTAVAKVPLVAEFAQEILEDSDTKLVIFGHHEDVLDYLMANLAEFNPVRLDGKMSQTQKQASVDAFQKDPSVRVFVGSTLASGEGITLTASSHVIFAELDWTPGRVTQAEDRCHRIGQFDSVLVQHLVLEGSLDAYIAELIVEKQRIADKALDNELKPIEVKSAATEIEVKELKLEGPLSNQQVEAIHTAMKMLAGVCDYANALDNRGFNKLDAEFGHSLANAPFLSQRQAGYAAKLANKYRRQLPKELLEAIQQKP